MFHKRSKQCNKKNTLNIVNEFGENDKNINKENSNSLQPIYTKKKYGIFCSHKHFVNGIENSKMKFKSKLNKNFSKQIKLKNLKERQLEKYFDDHLLRVVQKEEKCKYNKTFEEIRNQIKCLYTIPKEIDIDVIPKTSEFDEKALWVRGMVEAPISTEEKLQSLIGIEDSKRKILQKNVLLEVRKKLKIS